MLANFNQTVMQADGRFLNDPELQALQTYAQSFSTRQTAYQRLSKNSEALIIAALRQLATTHRQEVQTNGAKCKRDMDYVLKEIAQAVLMGDSEVFQQGFALWMENITRAVHTTDSAAQAYTCLKVVIKQAMPADCEALVVPYIDDLITSFSRT